MLNTSKDLLTTGTLNVVGDLRYEAWHEIMKWEIFFNSDILYHEMQEQLQKNGFFKIIMTSFLLKHKPLPHIKIIFKTI